MTLTDYVRSLSYDDLRDYANKCSTSMAYIKIHLLPARKIPKRPLMESLVKNSNGNLTMQDVLDHFYKTENQVT